MFNEDLKADPGNGVIVMKIGTRPEAIRKAAAGAGDNFAEIAQAFGERVTAMLMTMATADQPNPMECHVVTQYFPETCQWCTRTCCDGICGPWLCGPRMCEGSPDFDMSLAEWYDPSTGHMPPPAEGGPCISF